MVVQLMDLRYQLAAGRMLDNPESARRVYAEVHG
jgi:ribosomal protein L29